MITKRMMAIVAVVALAIPTLGAAAPIVQPPVTERLVEGHTVFTVITQTGPGGTCPGCPVANTSRFAAAAAVLVREYAPGSPGSNPYATTRFPGVLWFNDQYLVDPSYGVSPGYRNPAGANAYRYPCGGAVMAVNKGDADPRVSLVGLDGVDVLNSTFTAVSGPNGQVGGPAPTSNIGISTLTPSVSFGADLPVIDYKESYLITDPNDHSWVIDKYVKYTTVSVPGGVTATTAHAIWVVNILGHPGFLPDDGINSCDPFSDLTVVPNAGNGAPYAACTASPYPCGSVPEHQDEATAAPLTYNALRPANCAGGNVTGINVPNTMAAGDFRDEPCKGYVEPANGYCYDGNAQAAGTSCANKALYPVRAYNALLYFRMEDLKVYAGGVNHGAGNLDTNGCQVGTEWACPGGDDNAEGNSHPFNPHNEANAADPETAQPCPYAGSAEPSNHGGSDAQVNTGVGNVCDRIHATFDVDIYFSATGRPLEPVVRFFGVTDLEGSEAPFHGTGTDKVGDLSPG